MSTKQLPAQSDFVGAPVSVKLRSNPYRMFEGQIVRDDLELPNVTLVRLADGTIVNTDDCLWE